MHAKNQAESMAAFSFKKMFLSCVVGAAVAFLSAFILMLIVGLIAYPTGDPMSFAPAGYAVFLVSAFICGFLSAKKAGGKALFCGAIGGAVYLAVVISMSLLLTQEDMGIRRIVLLLSAFAVSIVGAALTLSGSGAKRTRKPPNLAAAKLKKHK